ncbi:MAG: HEAT repeat domain-containing protein [Planctomycetota bacterium]|jgi:hypothetical protein
MRTLFALTLLATAVLAGEKTPEDLVAQLGHVDYQVREDATKALTAMGQKAIPALEKALESDDVEVRMRAGRALRSIRARKVEPKPKAKQTEQPRKAQRFGTTNRSVSIRLENGTYIVTITTHDKDGKKTTKSFSGKSLEQMKKDHPEVREALGQTRLGVTRDPFKDFDKWFEDGWGGRRDDEFWKRADQDLNQEIERLRAWARRLSAQQQRARRQLPRSQADTHLLGVRARRPEAVLDAQLELRGKGLVIEEVARDSLAARLTLLRFDILVELNGMPIRDLADVGPALRSLEKKAPVTAKVMRRGRALDLKSTR